MNKPPITAARTNFLFTDVNLVILPDRAEPIKAPKIIPMLDTVVGSARTLFSRAVLGYSNCQ